MSGRRQVPQIINGAGGQEDLDAEEWRAAWRKIADGCDEALKTLRPSHPRRPMLLSLRSDARLAAGLPDEPVLQTASTGSVRTVPHDDGHTTALWLRRVAHRCADLSAQTQAAADLLADDPDNPDVARTVDELIKRLPLDCEATR